MRILLLQSFFNIILKRAKLYLKKSEEIKNLLDTLQLDIDRTSTTTKDFENEVEKEEIRREDGS